MTDHQVKHRRAITRAAVDRSSGRQELLDQILSLPFAERVKLPHATLAKLTSDQLALLLGAGAPPEKVSAVAKPLAGSSSKSSDQPYSLMWRLRFATPPPLVVATAFLLTMAVSLSAGAALTAPLISRSMGAGPTRTIDASEWPTCRRLTSTVDGCVYVVRSSLPWPYVAASLGIAESDLRNLNPHLKPRAALAPGDPITVWRGRGTLITKG